MSALFQLYNVHTRKYGSDTFTCKGNAKAARNVLNGGLCTDGGERKWLKDKGWRVTLGPDHRRYKS